MMEPSQPSETEQASSLAAQLAPVFRRIGAALAWALAFALGALPPLLVMLDRWFKTPYLRDAVRKTWCQVDFLCQTPLPSYFLWIFPAWLAFTGLALWATRGQPLATPANQPTAALPAEISSRQRRVALRAAWAAGLIALISVVIGILSGRIPGAELLLAAGCLLFTCWLLGEPYVRLEKRLIAAVRMVLPLAFGWLMLILFLRDLSTPGGSAWLSGLCLALLLLFALVRRAILPPVYWIASLALVLLTWQIGSWRFSVIGDEFSFLFSARELAVDQTVWTNLNRVFDGLLVYHSHPYLSSLIQATGLRLLGVDNFGWRFSNLFMIAASLFFFYRFFSRFLSRRVALVSVALLGGSHYLMTFGKIGYNNPQALFLLGLLLWAGSQAVFVRNRFSYAVLGAVMGLALYIYPAALYALPLPILLILFYDPPNARANWRRYLAAAALFVLLYLPVLFQPEYWLEKLPGTFLNPDNPAGVGNLGNHLAINFVYALFSYLYAVSESHFVAVSYVDPLTALLLPVGLGWLAGRLREERFARYWLLAFLYMLIVVGATHDRSTPSTTRMFLLLPWFCSLAALGLDWLVSRLRTSRRAAGLITGLVLACVVLANLFMAYSLTYQRYAGVGGLETFFLRLLQRDQRVYGDSDKTYLFITQEKWGIDGLRTLRDLYGLPQSQAQLVRIAVEEPTLPLDMLLLAQREDTLIILQPSMESPLRESVEARLDGLGKLRCQVRDTLESKPVFTYWYAERWQKLCPQNADWSMP